MDLKTIIENEVKSEREKWILYINTYMWNLEKWYRWSWLKNRNRNIDIKSQCMDTKGGEGGDELED